MHNLNSHQEDLNQRISDLVKSGSKVRVAALIVTELGPLLVKNQRKCDIEVLERAKAKYQILKNEYEQAVQHLQKMKDQPSQELCEMAIQRKNEALLKLIDAEEILEAIEDFLKTGRYHLPGGTPEVGEDPMEAAIRETFEETRLLIDRIVPIEIFEEQTENGPIYHAIYLARANAGAPAPDSNQPAPKPQAVVNLNSLRIKENKPNEDLSFGFMNRNHHFPIDDDSFYREHVLRVFHYLFESDAADLNHGIDKKSKEFNAIGRLWQHYDDYINQTIYCTKKRFLRWMQDLNLAAKINQIPIPEHSGLIPHGFRIINEPAIVRASANTNDEPASTEPHVARKQRSIAKDATSKSSRYGELAETGERQMTADIRNIMDSIPPDDDSKIA